MDYHSSRLSRRQLMLGAAGLGLVVGCGRLPWQAQQPRVAGVAVFGPGSGPEPFLRGLRERDYIEGQNLVVETRRWAGGSVEQLPTLAAELVGLQPDVIVSSTGPPAQAVVQATSTIPVVFVNV